MTRPRSYYNIGEDPVTMLTWTQPSARLDSGRDTDYESRTFEVTGTSDHHRCHLERSSVFTELEESRTNSLRSVELAASRSTK
ncbi:hypothetical protein PM082_001582 [Marasmius tenuissimus]|nr:hypothetical protein PM082_001582 [Marasmius tenuissimus]